VSISRCAAVAVALLALGASLGPASAERLVTSLSTYRISIASNFTGADLVLFGTVEQDASTVGRRGGYDIVVTVTGPRQTVVTWRKDRILGIWVNAESRTFVEVPSYLAVLANRALDAIAGPQLRRRQQIGITNTLLTQDIAGDVADVVRDDPFRM